MLIALRTVYPQATAAEDATSREILRDLDEMTQPLDWRRDRFEKRHRAQVANRIC